MPGNFLEQEGLKLTAKWAAKQGLKVFINRPLNAFNMDGAFRLASYPKPDPPYEQVKAQTLAFLGSIPAPLPIPGSTVQKPPLAYQLAAFVQYIDSELPHQTSILSYDALRLQIRAELLTRQSEIHGDWGHALDRFLAAFEDEVRWRGTRNVEKYMEARSVDLCGRRVEEAAIGFLLEEKDVDCVLLGMTRKEYVESARNVLRGWGEEGR